MKKANREKPYRHTQQTFSFSVSLLTILPYFNVIQKFQLQPDPL